MSQAAGGILQPMFQSPATAAEYLRLGLETDSVPLALPIRWADTLIAASETAAGDFVEVAWSRTKDTMSAALSSVAGDRSVEQAARWLLCTLRQQLEAGREASDVIKASMCALEGCGLGEAQRLRLAQIAAALDVATMGYHGTTDAAVADLAGFLIEEGASELPQELKWNHPLPA